MKFSILFAFLCFIPALTNLTLNLLGNNVKFPSGIETDYRLLISLVNTDYLEV